MSIPAALVFALGLCSCAHAVVDGEDPLPICGDWKVERIISTPNVQGTSKANFVGRTVSYAHDRMRFGSAAIEMPKYVLSHQSAADFFDGARFELKQLGITGDSVVVVEVRNASNEGMTEPGTLVFVRNNREIVTGWDGVYYELLRTRACAGRQGDVWRVDAQLATTVLTCAMSKDWVRASAREIGVRVGATAPVRARGGSVPGTSPRTPDTINLGVLCRWSTGAFLHGDTRGRRNAGGDTQRLQSHSAGRALDRQ